MYTHFYFLYRQKVEEIIQLQKKKNKVFLALFKKLIGKVID